MLLYKCSRERLQTMPLINKGQNNDSVHHEDRTGDVGCWFNGGGINHSSG
jgi:ribosomal protein S11